MRHNKKYFIGGHFSPPGKEIKGILDAKEYVGKRLPFIIKIFSSDNENENEFSNYALPPYLSDLTRVYSPPITPCDRVMAYTAVSP